MSLETVRGVTLNVEILGTSGPWVALSPGGRRALDGMQPLGERLARAGYRVLLHDRRNCGAADVSFSREASEYEIWADDLHALLGQHDAQTAIIGGSSSGCRLSLLFALRHPKAVRALLLWRITGGRFATERLAENYYSQYIAAAQQGGMAAICASEHFAERIAARPSNRDKLMAMAPQDFIAVMTRWREIFLAGAELPVIGASEADLRSIAVPACVVPGNDRTHGQATGRGLAKLLPNCELHELFDKDLDVDIVPPEEWAAKDDELAAIYLDFLKRKLG